MEIRQTAVELLPFVTVCRQDVRPKKVNIFGRWRRPAQLIRMDMNPSTRHPTRDILSHRQPRDAALLARFWNESADAWPGGSSPQRDVDDAVRYLAESGRLAIFTVEADRRFVAYCDLYARPGQKRYAYVPTLGAHQDYHGKKYGKSVLLAAVERAYELGYDRVDLGTWAGNTKAVPLYKKSGFMWQPDTHVHMMNFTPAARRHPLGHAYFAKHDWYDTHVRDLTICEDCHWRGKVRVFPYEWRAQNGDHLRMVFDRQSWGLVEVGNNRFRVACFLDDENLVAGQPQRIRWEIDNHTGTPLEVALIASGDPGIAIDKTATTRVGTSAKLDAVFEIDPDSPRKEKEPRVPIITTRLLVDGTPITLKAGFSLRQPVEMFMDPVWPMLRPGRPERVHVYLRSRLSKACHVVPTLLPDGVAEVAVPRKRVRLRAGEVRAVSATVTAVGDGALMLNGRCEVIQPGRRTATRQQELPVLVAGLMGCAGGVGEERVVLAGPMVRAHVFRRHGHVRVLDVLRFRRGAGADAPRVGPPFPWEGFFVDRADARVERTPNGLCAVLTSENVFFTGLRVERRVSVGASPVVRIDDTIINGSGKRMTLQLQREAWVDGRTTVLPARDDVVSERHGTGARDLWQLRLSDKPEDRGEGWVAAETTDGGVSGLIWSDATRVEGGAHWAELFHTLDPLEPGQCGSASPLYLYVGPGDRTIVRSLWNQLHGDHRLEDEVLSVATRRPVTFGLRPDPLIVCGQAKATLHLSHPGRFELSGSMRLTMPRGVGGDVRTAAFTGVCADRPFAKRVAITARPGRRAKIAQAKVVCRDGKCEQTGTSDVIVAAAGQGVRATTEDRGQILIVDNGVVRVAVAPAFGGSAIALDLHGMNQLRTAYPESHPMAWWNPWFGGIMPALASLRGNLAKEAFTSRRVTRRGAQGLTWRGVRVQCTPKQERARGQRMALEYLLTDGLPVLGLVVERKQLYDCPFRFGAGFDLFPSLGGETHRLTLRSALDESLTVLPGRERSRLSADPWGMVANPKTGHAMLVTSTDERARPSLGNSGQVGGVSIGGQDTTRLGPKQTRRVVFFVALASDVDTVRPFACLHKLDGLP